MSFGGRKLICRYCCECWILPPRGQLSSAEQLLIVWHLRKHFRSAASPTARALAELGLMEAMAGSSRGE